MAVGWEQGSGTAAVATMTHAHARDYLRAARGTAGDLSVDAALVDEHAHDAAHRLLDLAADHDLLAIGIPGHARPGGIVIGSVATAVNASTPS